MMPRRSPPTLFALLLVSLFACDGGGGPTELAQPEVLGEVVGVVTVEGVPIFGVAVALSGGVTRSSTTDANGAYRFQGIPEGTYVVTLTQLPAQLELVSNQTTILIRAGASVARADFAGSWRRDASILVSVEVEGVGLEGISVTLTGPDARAGTTDESGAVAFEDVRAGVYTVAMAGHDAASVDFAVVERSVEAVSGEAVEVRFDGTLLIPSVPASPGASATGSSSVRVFWDDLSDNEGSFVIERAEGAEGAWLEIGSVGAGATEFVDSGLSPATAYRYRIRACNAGACSEASEEALVVTDDVPPVEPTGLEVTVVGPYAVDLAWTDASDNEDSFELERRGGVEAEWQTVATLSAGSTGFSDSGLLPATSYTYRVRACNEAGCSDFSNVASGETVDVPPQTPADLQATASGPSTIDVAWQDASDNETSFELVRMGGGGAEWSEVAVVGANVATFSDTGLGSSTLYTYRVRACNDVGCSDYSAEASATTDDVAPAAPLDLWATATGSASIHLTWTDGSDNEASIEVERRLGGSWSDVATLAANTTELTDTGLSPATSYTYRVRACNGVGCSDYSAEASATTNGLAPDPPFNLSATATGTGSIDLAWTDGSNNETLMEIERRQGGPWSDVATLAANTVGFTDTGLSPSTSYTYRVRACNSEGCSSWSAEATATTDAVPSGPNLTISALYITQRTQRLTGDVPLVADLGGYLRVFATATTPNAFQPTVDVEFYLGGSLASTESLVAASPGVPTSVDESSFTTSWNVVVPPWLIQPGLSVRAVVDPGNAVAETDEGDNEFPTGGAPLPMDVRDPSPFRVTLVPVRQSVNGMVGGVSAGNTDDFMTEARRLFPVASDDVALHAEYTTTAPVLQSDDGNGAWGTILSEINALRTTEGSSRYYYGVVHPTYGGGIAGLGYIGWPAAIGWDKLPSGAGVAAHEWGHNLGRPHSPGCGAGGPDPAYPYAGGAIGVWGYDVTTATSRSPTAYYDLMSYCSPEWISDYVYEKILEFREGAPAMAVPAVSGEGMLVWGRVEGERAILEPTFRVVAPAFLPAEGGDFTLEGRDDAGELLFSFRFQPMPVADGADDQGHFAFVVPMAALAGRELVELSVTRGGVQAAVRRAVPSGLVAPAAPAAEVVAPDGGTAEVRWNAATHPMVLIRDAETGQVLSFARGGTARVRPSSDRIHLVFSDGVSSSAPQVRDWR